MESAARRWATFTEACAALKLEHPDKADMIDAWFERFDEMMAGPIAATVDILAELREFPSTH